MAWLNWLGYGRLGLGFNYQPWRAVRLRLRWTMTSGYRLRHDGGGRPLMSGIGWQTEDAGFRGWWRGSFGTHGVRMGNQMGAGELRENHVSVWDTLVLGFFEQMGRACLKFGEVQTLPPS